VADDTDASVNPPEQGSSALFLCDPQVTSFSDRRTLAQVIEKVLEEHQFVFPL
jgi:hypothetical protein